MRAGSKEAYNVAATLEEFARPGGSQADLTLDLAKGFATLEGTGRDEAASELRSLSVSSGLARVVNARVEERHREGSTVVTQVNDCSRHPLRALVFRAAWGLTRRAAD